MLELLYRLTAAYGPSGRETRVAEILMELLQPHVDEVDQDRIGNVVALRRGRPGGRRMVFAAHMDTAGAFATQIGDQGLIQLAPVGGLKVQFTPGQRVVWGSGAVGVLQHQPVEDPKELEFRKLWCDIGAASREEAVQNVRVGDVCTFVGDLQQMGDAIVGPGLDNRAGCAALIQVARHLLEPEHEVLFVFGVQGKTALRGVGLAAEALQPDLALLLHVSPSADVAGGPRTGTRLGGGPVLRLKEATTMPHHGLLEQIRELASTHAIPLQTEVLPSGGPPGELAGVVAAGAGIPAATLGIPGRYTGSAAEMVNLRDLHGAVDLLLKLAGAATVI